MTERGDVDIDEMVEHVIGLRDDGIAAALEACACANRLCRAHGIAAAKRFWDALNRRTLEHEKEVADDV